MDTVSQYSDIQYTSGSNDTYSYNSYISEVSWLPTLLFLYLVHNDPSSPLECGVVLKCSFKVLIVQILVQDIQENLLFVEMLSKSFHFILANC